MEIEMETEPEATIVPIETFSYFDFDRYPAVSVGMENFISAYDAVAIVLAQQLGISLTPFNLGEHDYEMLASMASADTLPDVLRVDTTSAYFISWVEQGTLREWPLHEFDAYPLLQRQLQGNDELTAINRLYGGQNWFLPMQDNRIADSGRIYVRRDWIEELNINTPDTLVDYQTMLAHFSENRKPGLAVAGGVTYLISLFGTDPESWIYENDEWIPAYYSRQMVRGLQFVRTLYENGLLDREFSFTKANAAIQKLAHNQAGSLIRHGDGYWLSRTVNTFAEIKNIPPHMAWDKHLLLLPPPAVPFHLSDEIPENEEEIPVEWRRYWPRSVEKLGAAVPASVDDEQFERICKLLEYIASDESHEMAYFGIRGETCLPDTSGRLRLFVDPNTARPYNITQKYPAAQVLFLLGRSHTGELDTYVPSELPPTVKQAGMVMSAFYDAAVIDEGDGFLARFIHTPANTRLRAELDYSAYFNDIVMGSTPVEEMFEAFRLRCEEYGIRAAIDEMSARLIIEEMVLTDEADFLDE